MSPSIHFPSPFGGRELPPYGPADWKRIQPALLRRSLALSSMAALLASLVLGLVLQRSPIPIVKPTVVVLPPPPGVPPPIDPGPPGKPPIVVPRPPDEGNPLEVDSTQVVISDDPTPITSPIPIDGDPNGKARWIPGDNRGETDSFPERPNPKDTVILDELPIAVYFPKPEYPEIARQAGIEGTVFLQALVNREGRVVEVLKVVSSPIFDESAEKAIHTWRFRPALVGNRPVPAWVTVPVRFVMR